MNKLMLPCEEYDANMLRRWHDGPVIVLDTMAVHLAHDDSTKYIVCSEDEVETTLRNMHRPTAACVYVLMSLKKFHSMWKCKDVHDGIDVRFVIM